MNGRWLATLLGISLFGTLSLAASNGLAHDPPPQGEADHQHPEGQHDGVYDHGHDDGHHHHPHAHSPAATPSPNPAPAPYAYTYGYQPSGYSARPRVIEGWEPGDPVPDGYRPDTQPRSGLVKAGAATLFSIYGLTAIVGSFLVMAEDIDAEDGVDGNGVDAEAYYPLFIPVAGPFATIATAETDRAGTTALIANGVAQTAGLAMFIAGLAAREEVLVRIPTYGQASMEVKPIVGKGFQGVGVDGSF